MRAKPENTETRAAADDTASPGNVTYIGDRAKGRKNNFDFLRFFAAGMVIVSHSYPLSGTKAVEPMNLITRGQFDFGSLAVMVFFIISGFLITASYLRSRSLVDFIRKRALRIVPGLAAVLVVTAFILGPFVTTLPLSQYFSSGETYEYLKTITLRLHRSCDSLPGVFVHNALPRSVNGALWTLFYEVVCYAFVAVLGLVGLLRKPVVVAAFLASLVARHLVVYFRPESQFLGGESLALFQVFAAGMLCYLYKDKIPLDRRLALAAVVLLVVLVYFGQGGVGLAIAGTYLTLYLAYSNTVKLNDFAQRGDMSYGLYIYAFPIQQTLTYFFGGRMSQLLNLALAFPLAVACAYMSWHLVEKRFLALKGIRFGK